MSRDIQLFCACNHIVDNVQYFQSQCPRCYGKGYYFDIYFDLSGSPVLASGGIKLQQETVKILLDEKFGNPFHPFWGSQVNNLIGTKNMSINKIKVEVIVRNTLDYLRKVQINESLNWNNFTEEEILDSIKEIKILPIKPTGYHIEVTIANSIGDVYVQSIDI